VSKFKLLVVEDDIKSQERYTLLIDEEYPDDFDVVYCRSEVEAFEAVKVSKFDGAVVDLKLSGAHTLEESSEELGGNRFIEEFTSEVRCPVVVFTANTANLSEIASGKVFRVIDRAAGFNEVLRLFSLIQKSGMAEIMNKGGLVEQYLDKIYWDVFAKRVDIWTSYCDQGKETKNALLRLMLYHLIEFIDQDQTIYFPDEVYLKVFDSEVLRTGQLFKNNDTAEMFIIISPACDLFVHGDGPKSDFVQLCRIYCHNEEPVLSYIKNAEITLPDNKHPDYEKLRILRKKSKSFIENAAKNGADFYHYLPKSGIFKGGVINFREVKSVARESFIGNFSPVGIQVSTPFLKDIVGRYSSYYARQGQPTFDWGGVRPEELIRG